MIQILKQNGEAPYGLNEYIIDTKEELPKIPKNISMGSSVFVVEENKTYILDGKKQWIEKIVSTNTSNGGITNETDPTVPAWAKTPLPPIDQAFQKTSTNAQSGIAIENAFLNLVDTISNTNKTAFCCDFNDLFQQCFLNDAKGVARTSVVQFGNFDSEWEIVTGKMLEIDNYGIFICVATSAFSQKQIKMQNLNTLNSYVICQDEEIEVEGKIKQQYRIIAQSAIDKEFKSLGPLILENLVDIFTTNSTFNILYSFNLTREELSQYHNNDPILTNLISDLNDNGFGIGYFGHNGDFNFFTLSNPQVILSYNSSFKFLSSSK